VLSLFEGIGLMSKNLNNVLIDSVLNHLPRNNWNFLCSLCASFSFPTIGSPIRFSYNSYTLEEYPTNELPQELYPKFIEFCYPMDLPDRLQQIEYDRELYWKDTSTFIVFDATGEIVGCIQIILRSTSTKLPVEYADVVGVNGEIKKFDLKSVVPHGEVTEIYRCRRSFALKEMGTFCVLLMLFKAVRVKSVQLGTAYSCVSFDARERGLHHLYCKKLAFVDPGIPLAFGSDPTRWSLLVKDWDFHEKKFAALSKKQFYMQIWFRKGVR
jgi:hypothetical protein